jgi:tetratricopeptide (TPR) repeat protein
LSGLGTHHREVSTTSTWTQRYFDQGLALLFGYHYVESVASFREAIADDPECPMAWWGLAMAAGPNPNSRYFNHPDDPQGVGSEASQRARELEDGATPLERALIDAVVERYDAEKRPEPGDRDRAYTEAMQAIFEAHPDDADIAVLYGESRMMQSPWQYWNPDGSGRVGADEAKRALEHALRLDPGHPGANHYYIHLMEDGPDPTVVLPNARILGDLMPNAGHIVHMPSHIYIQTGRYEEAVRANRASLAADRRLLAEWGDRDLPVGVPSMPMRASLKGGHARRFLHLAALRLGSYDQAVEAMTAVLEGPSPDMETLRGNFRVQILWSQLWLTHRAFGRWQEVLDIPEVPSFAPVAAGNRRAARGCAWLARGDLDKAAEELGALDEIIGQVGPPVQGLLGVPRNELAGLIEEARGETERAIGDLETAVRLEDSLPYYEPPIWQNPVRNTLGYVLLRAGRPQEAATVFWEDLRRHPENGRALFGLWKSLEALGDAERAVRVADRFREAWAGQEPPVVLGFTRTTSGD